MAKLFTTRFYQVRKAQKTSMGFRDALDKIAARGKPGARQYQLAQGFICRLERLQLDEVGFVSGAMTRIRDTDFPAEITDDGALELNVAGPIGNSVVFRFREHDHTLAMQFDNRIMSPPRFISYINGLLSREVLRIRPKVDADALKKFRESPLRKLKIQLASIQNLGAVEQSMQAVATSVRELGQGYEAPIITLEMSMGHHKGSLGDSLKSAAEGFLNMITGDGGAEVRALKATSLEEDGSESIDLIDQLLSDKAEINLESNNPEEMYNNCMQHLREVLECHV